MPRRLPFNNGKIYYVYNKMIDEHAIFEQSFYSDHFIELIRYYRSTKSIFRFSFLKELSETFRMKILKEVSYQEYFRVNILAYCLMPNHFHLLLQQKKENGISTFLANILNSLTRFHNTIKQRKGPLFLTQFRSKRIYNEEELIHVSRYIHLNPYSSLLVKEMESLVHYKWSSLKDYVYDNTNSLCKTTMILNHFGRNRKRYFEFIQDNAEHQRTLEFIKHIDKWK